MTTSEPLVEFFLRGGKDQNGRTLYDILLMTDEQLESSHDVVQWCFPLTEPSNFNDAAPQLDEEQVKEINNPDNQFAAQFAMIDGLNRFLRFFGLERRLTDDGLVIVPGWNYNQNKQWLATPRNHNFLRITRIIRSLRLFQLDDYAQAFYQAVRAIAAGPDGVCINDVTLQYWDHAFLGDLSDGMQKPRK